MIVKPGQVPTQQQDSSATSQPSSTEPMVVVAGDSNSGFVPQQQQQQPVNLVVFPTPDPAGQQPATTQPLIAVLPTQPISEAMPQMVRVAGSPSGSASGAMSAEGVSSGVTPDQFANRYQQQGFTVSTASPTFSRKSSVSSVPNDSNEQSLANSATRQPISGNPADDKGPKQLIVNYIAPTVTEVELRALFEQFGPVDSARIIYDKHTGGTKGFGFVYFVWSEHAAKAIKYLQGFELYGKYLRVGYAVPQRPPPSSNQSSPSASMVATPNTSGSYNSFAAQMATAGATGTQSQSLAALVSGAAPPPPYVRK